MSSNVDPRVQRTRQLLGEALLHLGANGDVDALDVGDITAKAGIGRSTFYQHFASKDDFLVRAFVNLIARMETEAERRPQRLDLLPSQALFDHVKEAHAFVREMIRSKVYPWQMAAGEAKLRAIAEANLARRMPHWSTERRRETAIYIAGGFIGLLRWWMEGGLTRTPEQMQAAFERLSQSALGD